jgi:hypothetical protein
MGTSPHDYRRPMLVNAVRDLVIRARSERTTMAPSSPERAFLLGVEAAAEEVLHPELSCAREAHWLDRESPAFRAGYLEASALLATAMAAEEPPQHLPLPDSSAVR